MTERPTTETNDKPKSPPAPEILRAESDDGSVNSGNTSSSLMHKSNIRLRHGVYRPTHKATFVGLAVVVLILAINAGVIAFLINNQGKATSDDGRISDVTISPDVLNTLGVSRNAIGNSGSQLTVNPNSTFKGTVTVGGEASIAGQLKLNSKLIGTDASLGKLEAGDTSLSQLNVNGDGTLSNLNLRNDLTVVGSTRLQGAVTVSQLFTVANNMNISGNLAVGGILSARGFQASDLTSDTLLTIGGHIVSRGVAPSVNAGSAVGSNGTVSISGNDASGTVAVNIGTGGGNGVLANIAFNSQYGNTPHVIITAVGRGAGSVYINRNVGGFSIVVDNALSPGGYIFDYIVMQ